MLKYILNIVKRWQDIGHWLNQGHKLIIWKQMTSNNLFYNSLSDISFSTSHFRDNSSLSLAPSDTFVWSWPLASTHLSWSTRTRGKLLTGAAPGPLYPYYAPWPRAPGGAARDRDSGILLVTTLYSGQCWQGCCWGCLNCCLSIKHNENHKP